MIEFKIELYKLNYNLIDMSSSFHNQSLYYKDIKSNLPNRKNFIDVDLNVALENDIANKKHYTFYLMMSWKDLHILILRCLYLVFYHVDLK